MTAKRSNERSWNGKLNALAVVAVGVALIWPTALAGGIGGDAAPSRTVQVTPEEGSQVMSHTVRVPLEDPASGLASDNSSCRGIATDSCTGANWTLHCCVLEFETEVFVGTVAETTNSVTGTSGASDGNVWEQHCSWSALFGFCTLHQHGGLFQGDDVEHSGSATYDLCVPGLCEWTVHARNKA